MNPCIEIRQRTRYPVKSVRGKSVRYSRWAYEQVHGPIPAGLEIDHLCFNTRCVNVDHLEAVTHLENIHRSRSTRLTEERVAEIRRLLDEGLSQRKIASMFGVSQGHISDINRGKRWAITGRKD